MKKEGTTCEECTLKEFKYVKPYFAPVKQLPLLFVGQAPGAVETVTGIPFTGPAGKMLWRLLKEAGIDKLRVDISNVAKCAPPGDRKPTSQEITICKELLKQDIYDSKPKLIVALGDVAAKTLVGSAKIMSLRGTIEKLLPYFDYDCEVLCTLHPSFVMRQRQWIDIAVQDFMKALFYVIDDRPRVIREEPTLITEIDEYQLVTYLVNASKYPTAVDTETTGLNPRTDKVIGASLCHNDFEAIAFDLLPNDPKWEPLKHYLEDKNAPKITQNGQFDVAMLDGHGINVEGLVFDTRLAEHLISSDLPSSLDFLRSKYTDVKPYKPSMRERKNIAFWTREKRLNYGCHDALVTFLVYKKQLNEIDSGNLKVLHTIEIPLMYVVNEMEKRGVLVDTYALDKWEEQTKPEMERVVREYFDPIGLNPNSPKQLSQFFGIGSTGAEDLKAHIKRGHPQSKMMEVLLDYRDLQKTYSVYIEGIKERMEYGRIHTHYKAGGAGTGRLSSENPNLQNVPKALRNIYIPDPSNIFVEADYNQLELRVLAVVADERTMTKEIANGLNIHHKMGAIIFGKPWSDLEEKQRVWAKNVVFGTAYGRGPTAIARQFGCTIKEASEWQTACLQQYPGFLGYHQKQKAVFERTGKAFTPFGRSRPIQSVTQAFNSPIQSAGSDVCLTSLILLHNKGFRLMFTVHDSITIQADVKTFMDEADEMKRIMERPIEEMNFATFPVKVGAGYNWRVLEELKI